MSNSRTKPSATFDKKSWRDMIPEDRLAHLVQDARRGMERALQIRLSEHSVSFGHWSYLRILWEHDGLTQRELSEIAGVTAPTTSSAMNAIESLGYVKRIKKPDNKKNIYVYLTKAGRALKGKLLPLAEEVNATAIHGLKSEEVRIARKVLLKIIANLVVDEQNLLISENRRVPSTRELGRLMDE
ncbi:MAG: MarR family transcriptional regulator [Paralcaligenes sp.]